MKNTRFIAVSLFMIIICLILPYSCTRDQSPEPDNWYWETGSNLFVHAWGPRQQEIEFTVEQLTEVLSEIPAGTVNWLAHQNVGNQIMHPSKIKYLTDQPDYDMTAVWQQACKNTGKKFCIYFNSHGLVLGDDRPDWVRRKADGSPCMTVNNDWADGYRMCVKPSNDSTGFLEQYLLPVVEEFMTRYKPDAVWSDGDWHLRNEMCWCDHCREAWELKTGLTSVPMTPDDPDWHEWVRLHWERIDVYHETVAEFIHSIHPQTLYSSNDAWRINPNDPRSAPDFVGYLTHDFSYWDAIRGTRVASMTLSSEEQTPHDIMHITYDPPGKVLLPRMLQEGALTLAAGSVWHMWAATVSPFDSAAAANERARITASFVKDRSPAGGKTLSENPVAVLTSETSWGKQQWEGKVNHFNYHTTQNVALALQDAGYGVDIVNEQVLNTRGRAYSVVIIPNDQREILPETYNNLKNYVEEGNLLLIMGSGMLYAQGKDKDIHTILGIERTTGSNNTNSITINGKTHSFSWAWNVEPESAEVLAAYDNGNPFLTSKKVGNGIVAYMSADVPNAYPNDEGVYSWVLGKLNVNPRIEVKSGDEDKHLVFSIRSKPDQLLLHVTNLTSHVDGVRIEPHSWDNAIDPVAAIPRLELSLDMPEQPEEVNVVPAESDVEYTWEDGVLNIIITNLDYHAVVQITRDLY